MSRYAMGPRNAAGGGFVKRRTSLLARGEPMVWLTGAALTVAIGMILSLLAIVAWGGFGTFWQRPMHQVTLADGSTFLGIPVREESYDPGPDRRAVLNDDLKSGRLGEGALTDDGLPIRRLYRVGNKEILPQPFRWVDLGEIASIQTPADAVLLERTEWGVWLGVPQKLLSVEERVVQAASADEVVKNEVVQTRHGDRPAERVVLGAAPGGGFNVRETITIADGPSATRAMMARLLPEAEQVRRQIEVLKEDQVGAVNRRFEAARLAFRKVEIAHSRGTATAEQLDAAKITLEQTNAELNRQFDLLRAQIAEKERVERTLRLVITDVASGRFAPMSQTSPDEPMKLSQIVRAVAPNELGFGGKVGLYLSRWGEFLFDEPREANTEGGVMPVIFGTVIMTVLLSVLVVPFGVIAALYLREYARQGLIVSAVRIAVNNLAGVPSIVYGVFGLGFFCYTVGAFIDGGSQTPMPVTPWLAWFVPLIALIVGASFAQAASKPKPGKALLTRHEVLSWVALALWIGVAGVVIAIFMHVPTAIFDGLFNERLPTATFGTKGVLWASLTLALLTLPVVIVATEEAISAVPKSLREASYGCGASKWQTIKRVVLPRAAPGIMTGMILAMARGAGEVAPLMLVGAVKLAPELPFEPHFPFLHLERSFMHLGFHIYDLGFQSPDSEAARPLVWTTTLLLISIVVMLNLTAITIRARLRAKFVSGHF